MPTYVLVLRRLPWGLFFEEKSQKHWDPCGETIFDWIRLNTILEVHRKNNLVFWRGWSSKMVIFGARQNDAYRGRNFTLFIPLKTMTCQADMICFT